MNSLISKIRKSIAINGMVGTLKLSLAFVLRPFKRMLSTNNVGIDIQKRDVEFDQKWGVDTSGTTVPGEAEVVGANWVYGNKYQGCDPAIFSEVMADLAIRYSDFSFVDLGSGKGRAVLLASRLPFKRVVGVEFAEQLCQIARQNVARFPKTEMRCQDIETVCDDAARYQLPDSSLVIFLYNPFGKQVMEKVVQNVLTSYRQNPRRIIVVYMTAYFSDIWKNAGFLNEIRSDWIAIYDTKEPSIS